MLRIRNVSRQQRQQAAAATATTTTTTRAERGQLFEFRVHLQFVQGKTIKVP